MYLVLEIKLWFFTLSSSTFSNPLSPIPNRLLRKSIPSVFVNMVRVKNHASMSTGGRAPRKNKPLAQIKAKSLKYDPENNPKWVILVHSFWKITLPLSVQLTTNICPLWSSWSVIMDHATGLPSKVKFGKYKIPKVSVIEIKIFVPSIKFEINDEHMLNRSQFCCSNVEKRAWSC